MLESLLKASGGRKPFTLVLLLSFVFLSVHRGSPVHAQNSVPAPNTIIEQAQRLINLGAPDEAARGLSDFLASSSQEPPSPEVAAAQGLLGLIALETGDFRTAQSHFEDSIASANLASAIAVQARSAFNLAHVKGVDLKTRPSQVSAKLFGGIRGVGLIDAPPVDAATAVARTLSTEYYEAASLGQSAQDDSLAIEAYLLSARAARTAGDLSQSEHRLESALLILNQYPQARYHRQLVAIAEETAHVSSELQSSIPLAESVSISLSQLIENSEVFDDLGDFAYALGIQGRLYSVLNDRPRAKRSTRAAISLADQIQETGQLFIWQAQLAAIEYSEGQTGKALRNFERAEQSLRLGRDQLVSSNLFSGRAFHYDVVQPFLLAYLDILVRPADGSAPNRAALEKSLTIIDLLRSIEVEQFLGEVCVGAGASIRVNDIDPKAAILYPIVRSDRVDLIYVIGGEIGFVSTPETGTGIELTARRLAGTLALPNTDAFESDAGRLYDAIIAPISSRLIDAQTQHIAIAADGGLRAIPPAVLWDGEAFLVENYSTGLIPSLALIDATPFKDAQKRPLYLGVSQSVDGFEPLPEVPGELQAVSSIMPGPVLLDDAFTEEAVETLIAESPITILHMATHGVFGGVSDASYLLTGDSRLEIEALGDLVRMSRLAIGPLELLVLSACQTAEGDDRSILGLAGAAYRSGAKAVLGSLWSVSDASTAELQKAFYAELAQGASKGEALRQAQLGLIQSEEFSHPFYWSAFVLVGNWL